MTLARWAEYLEAATEAAKLGGEVLGRWRRRFAVREKTRFDLVTDADLDSERAIREFLAGRFPDHTFFGEEEQSAGIVSVPSGSVWIVDPLDGTTNYTHDCPGYCVSIGLLVGGELEIGVILDPCRQELFRAARAQGAWLGGARLHTSRVGRLENALIAMEAPYDLPGRGANVNDWRLLSAHAQAMRQMGSTALDLAYVAAGRLDAFWGPRQIHPWDSAAGAVLIREGGGNVTNIDGTSFNVFQGDIAASNGPLHPLLLGLK
jgi:myo-inositol-1(or 4)-monophosphatase